MGGEWRSWGRLRGSVGVPAREVSEVNLGGSRERAAGRAPRPPRGARISERAREAACAGDSGDRCGGFSRGPGVPRPALRARHRPGSLRGRGRPRGLGRPEVSPARPDPPPPRVRPALPATHRLGLCRRRRRRPGLLRPPPPPSPPLQPASSPPSSRTDHRRRRRRRRRAASPRRASPPLAPPRDRSAPALADAKVMNSAPTNGRRGQPEGREVCAEKGGVAVERGATEVERGPQDPPPALWDWSAARLTGSRLAGGEGAGRARRCYGQRARRSLGLGLQARRGQSRAGLPHRPRHKSQFLILAFKDWWRVPPAHPASAPCSRPGPGCALTLQVAGRRSGCRSLSSLTKPFSASVALSLKWD